MAKDLESRISNRTPENNGQAPLGTLIQNMQGEFQKAAPKGMEATQLVRDALTCLRQTPQLAECDPQSVLGSLMSCAQLGLRPGVLGHAWLLPFFDSKAGGRKAQLVVGYQGLVELAHRSGQIQSLIARTVYELDEFHVEYGLDDKLVHIPCLKPSKGKPVAYYAVAKMVNGGHAFFVMGHAEMLAYRDDHATAQKDGRVFGPWKDDFQSMAQKTVVRQLAKWLPKSTDFARALDVDNSVRVDLTPAAVDYAERPEGHLDVDEDTSAVDGEVVG